MHDRFYDVIVGKKTTATTYSQWEIERSVQENILKKQKLINNFYCYTLSSIISFFFSWTYLSISYNKACTCSCLLTNRDVIKSIMLMRWS